MALLASLPIIPGLECSSNAPGPTFEVPGPAGTVQNPRVALDGSGSGFIVYELASPGVGNRISSTPVNRVDGVGPEFVLANGGLSTTSNRDPQIEIDASGTATALWIEVALGNGNTTDRPLFRIHESGAWGGIQEIAADRPSTGSSTDIRVFSPDLSVAADGSVTLAWLETRQADGDYVMVTNNLVGSPATERDFQHPADGEFISLEAVTYTDNSRIVVYSGFHSAEGLMVSASLDLGAGFEPPIQLDAGIDGGASLTAAYLAPSGNPVVAWSGTDGLYWSAYFGGWMPAEAVPTDNSVSEAVPRLASDAIGNLWLTWSNNQGVFASQLTFDANRPLWGPAIQLNTQPASNAFHDVGVDPAGNVRVVWTEGGGSRLYSNAYRDGAWVGEEEIAQSAAIAAPDLAVDESLTAVAVWPNAELRNFIWADSPLPGATFSLTTQLAGNGTGTIDYNPAGVDCGAGCEEFASDTVVAIIATPDAGSTYAGLSGDPDCDDASVTMNQDVICTATFDEADVGMSYTVSLQISNQGGSNLDRVVSSPVGINCEAGPNPMNNVGTCSAVFNVNEVELEAIPDAVAGDSFDAWGGCNEVRPDGAGGPGRCIIFNPGDGSSISIGASFSPAGG